MFPFTNSFSYSFDTSSIQNFKIYQLVGSFEEHLEIQGNKPSSISFKNFKAFYKRHRWLDGGSLTITSQGKVYSIDLNLCFFTTPIIFLFLTAGLLIVHFNRIQLALALIAVLWVLYISMYFWTAAIFKASIRNIVKRQLYMQQTGETNNL